MFLLAHAPSLILWIFCSILGGFLSSFTNFVIDINSAITTALLPRIPLDRLHKLGSNLRKTMEFLITTNISVLQRVGLSYFGINLANILASHSALLLSSLVICSSKFQFSCSINLKCLEDFHWCSCCISYIHS